MAVARIAALSLTAASLLTALQGCSPSPSPPSQRRYLAITHSALNRLTLFDVDRRQVAGILPTHKLPHDMVLDQESMTLHVVCSGSQSISAYRLSSPALWVEAAEFMRRDTADRAAHRDGSRTMADHPGQPSAAGAGSAADVPPLNVDPVHGLPPTVVRHTLTDTSFPAAASAAHARVNAATHSSCFDCHVRPVGSKPFAPVFSRDSSSMYLVNLAARNLVQLDSRTGALLRTIPLASPGGLTPVEAWVDSAETTAVVTFRADIGRSEPGVIGVFNLQSGALRGQVTAGIYPWHLVPTGHGRRFYVNNFQSSRISVFDLDRMAIVDTIVVENGPSTMLPLPEGDRLLVSCFYTGRVLEVDLATGSVVRRIDAGANPTSIEPGPDGTSFFVLCGGESALLEVRLSDGAIVARHPLLFGAYAMLPFRL